MTDTDALTPQSCLAWSCILITQSLSLFHPLPPPLNVYQFRHSGRLSRQARWLLEEQRWRLLAQCEDHGARLRINPKIILEIETRLRTPKTAILVAGVRFIDLLRVRGDRIVSCEESSYRGMTVIPSLYILLNLSLKKGERDHCGEKEECCRYKGH
jgi:hypothetical protein